MTRDNHSDDLNAQRDDLLDQLLSRPRRTAAEKLRWLDEIKKRAAAQHSEPRAPQSTPAPAQREDRRLIELLVTGHLAPDAVEHVLGQNLWQAITSATTAAVEAENYATATREAADQYARQVRREAEAYADALRREAEQQAEATIAQADQYQDQALANAAATQRQARTEAEEILQAAQAEAEFNAFTQQVLANWMSAPTDERPELEALAARLDAAVDHMTAPAAWRVANLGFAFVTDGKLEALNSAAGILAGVGRDSLRLWDDVGADADGGRDVLVCSGGQRLTYQVKRWTQLVDGLADRDDLRQWMRDKIEACWFVLYSHLPGEFDAPHLPALRSGSYRRSTTIRAVWDTDVLAQPRILMVGTCDAAEEVEPKRVVLQGELVDHDVEGATSR
ncbi:hypothetical protein [Catellatospora sp. NPDC049609]|uniref:hypothetical protein n=1 Tax=Catellatospora sp. NPDC049609 TaxID=3155505 RepID=UPI00341D6914